MSTPPSSRHRCRRPRRRFPHSQGRLSAADHEAVDGPDEDVVDDDELDDVDDGRFARRNPIVDRALTGEGDTA